MFCPDNRWKYTDADYPEECLSKKYADDMKQVIKEVVLSSSLHSLYLQVPCPDVYRGKYRETDYPEECLGKKYADDVKQVIKKVRDNGRTVSAFITESLQSCGGQIIPPPNYLRNVIRWGKPNTINIKLISVWYHCVGSGLLYRVKHRWWGFTFNTKANTEYKSLK